MSAYVGCDYARSRLEPLLDGGLSLDEQVAVESHVRWCRTCAAHVEDVALIGTALRSGAPGTRDGQAPREMLDVVRQRVLLRVCAERQQAFTTTLRDQFADLRLFWPALGATCAVLCLLGVALGVLHRASIERPQSLATMLAVMANPGSERNPLRPRYLGRVDPFFGFVDSDRAGGVSLPRPLRNPVALVSIDEQEATFAFDTVVGRDGSVQSALLRSDVSSGESREAHAGHVAAVSDAVHRWRFAPAQTSLGRPVAVNVLWLFVVTRVETADPGQDALLPLPGTDAERPGGVIEERKLGAPTVEDLVTTPTA